MRLGVLACLLWIVPELANGQESENPFEGNAVAGEGVSTADAADRAVTGARETRATIERVRLDYQPTSNNVYGHASATLSRCKGDDESEGCSNARKVIRCWNNEFAAFRKLKELKIAELEGQPRPTKGWVAEATNLSADFAEARRAAEEAADQYRAVLGLQTKKSPAANPAKSKKGSATALLPKAEEPAAAKHAAADARAAAKAYAPLTKAEIRAMTKQANAVSAAHVAPTSLPASSSKAVTREYGCPVAAKRFIEKSWECGLNMLGITEESLCSSIDTGMIRYMASIKSCNEFLTKMNPP